MLCDKVDFGKRVACYRNLHFPNVMWSVKSMANGSDDYGRVISHSSTAFLADCTFHVSEAGRGRVLNEKRKNVHASVRGFWVEDFLSEVEAGVPITYNPYKYGTFVTVQDKRPIVSAERVVLSPSGPMAWGLTYVDTAELVD